MFPKNVRNTFPALRCNIGDWIYYVTYLKFSDVSFWIKRTDQIHKSENLRDMIQRQLSSRATPIVDYLINQKERFFNSIVVGVYSGYPQWFPIEVGDSPTQNSVRLDEDSSNSIGLLMLDGTENLFAIDGQHRVEAIKQAVEKESGLENEEIAVIFVAHKTDLVGQMRTRRLFSTLNRYAKPVAKGDIVALDEDDAFAITTRRLVEDFKLLKGFVRFGKTAPIPPNDHKNLTSILALYDIVTTLYIPFLASKKQDYMKSLKILRPSDTILDRILDQQEAYWNILYKYIPEYRILFESTPEQKIAGSYRTSNGGHLLFRPAGQQAFASVVRVLLDRGFSLEESIKKISSLPMNIAHQPWLYTMWDPGTKKMTKVSRVMHENLILYMINENPRTRNYDVLKEYQNILNKPDAIIPLID